MVVECNPWGLLNTYCVADARVLHIDQNLVRSQVLYHNRRHLEVSPRRVHDEGFGFERELHVGLA
jgi:hypothetical protein